MASHKDVCTAWVNGKAKSGYAMHTDGHNLYSHAKVIGRTLEDGTKQVLDLTGMYRVSASTGKHVLYAFRAAGYHSGIMPYVRVGHEEDDSYMQEPHSNDWNVLQFPPQSALVVRATKQVWKTYKGASAACLKMNNPDYSVLAMKNGLYTLFYMQYVNEHGHVVTMQEFYGL